MSGHISSIGDHHSDPAKAQVTIQHGATKKGRYPDSTHLTVSKEHAASLRLGQKVAVGIMPSPNC